MRDHQLLTLLWALPIAVSLHVFEEFAFPGGLREWIKAYKPRQPRSDFYYVAVNAAAIILASLIASLAAGPVGLCMYLYGAALMAANAASHLRATRQAKRYCPGSITGGLLLIPLLMISVWYLRQSGKLDWLWTFLSAGAGAAVGWLLFGVDLRRRVRGWNLA